MPSPRRSPPCATVYDSRHVERALHVTLGVAPGGARSPWQPNEPGRLLTLRCLACRGDYGWDSCAGWPLASPGAGAPPKMRRDPQRVAVGLARDGRAR